jgi:lipopolysaccharide assembly outer membrane protein LptD (OstA)
MPAALRTTLALLAVCAWASAVAADSEHPGKTRGFGEEPIELTADALDYDAAQQLYVASGNVVLRQGDRTLHADWVAFNRGTGVGIANGHVELRQGDELVRADFVQFDVNDAQGLIRNGEIDSPAGQFRALGEEIRKTGEHSYSLRRAVFTTCRCPKGERQPWQIRAREAEGGYGTVRDATVDVLGVPALWLPWLIFPVRTERQSGFLLPELSYGSRQGFEIGTPFFWAVRDNVNATLTPSYSTRRGFKGDASVEYLLGEESSGEVFGAAAYDQEVDPDSANEPFNRERWTVLGKQDLFLPADLRFRSDFRFVSDNDYPIDYHELRPYRYERWLQSWASLSRSFGESGQLVADGAAFYANDMQSPDDVDRDTTVLNRLPQLSLAALPTEPLPVSWLVPSLDASYVWYQATDRPDQQGDGFLDTGTDGVFDAHEGNRGPGPASDPHLDNFPLGGENDGKFEEGEPLTNDGQRFLFAPRLAAPFTLADVVELYPEIGWSEALYATREEAFADRGLFTARLDLRSRLRRRFGDVTHSIEPLFGYAYVSKQSQSNNPLLVPATAVPQQRIRELDLDAVTRDSADRVPRANRVTFGAAQQLRVAGEGATAVDAALTLLGGYELDESKFGWVIADGSVEPGRFGATRFHVGYDPEKTQVSEALLEWRWHHEAGHQVEFGYRYVRRIPNVYADWRRQERFDHYDTFDHIEQTFVQLRFQATERWRLGYRGAFSFDKNVFLQNAGLVEYISRCGCWAGGVELSMDRASGVNVRLIYRLIGLGDNLKNSPLLDSLEGL